MGLSPKILGRGGGLREKQHQSELEPPDVSRRAISRERAETHGQEVIPLFVSLLLLPKVPSPPLITVASSIHGSLVVVAVPSRRSLRVSASPRAPSGKTQLAELADEVNSRSLLDKAVGLGPEFLGRGRDVSESGSKVRLKSGVGEGLETWVDNGGLNGSRGSGAEEEGSVKKNVRTRTRMENA